MFEKVFVKWSLIAEVNDFLPKDNWGKNLTRAKINLFFVLQKTSSPGFHFFFKLLLGLSGSIKFFLLFKTVNHFKVRKQLIRR